MSESMHRAKFKKVPTAIKINMSQKNYKKRNFLARGRTWNLSLCNQIVVGERLAIGPQGIFHICNFL